MQDSAKNIQAFYELNVKPGKATELRAIASKMVAMNASEEPGTLVYNVYINDDETLFTFLETFSDSAHGIFHAGRFAEGEYVGQILERTMELDFAFMATSQKNLNNGPSTMTLSLNISV